MSQDAHRQNPEPGSLKDSYGPFVELTGDGDITVTYRIEAELAIDGRLYAILQSESMRDEGDIEVFRVDRDAQGSLHLETVEDDEEWERAAEAFDDLQFGSDERP
ncbi:DUF1292 domain-containing protein [Cohnella pontilimi]|uniref:DUF1292 domain-containing protein n=1 Tax=Cohnella pontilimi TaxID=2564100 RepID=A0A4U0FEY7_9BACL|nr:DUF1292 domain-containing protein [Cohnella pontilimi]TJY43513.1 DUF1292 domain-containing protein [Cohnella pontilimi]